MLDFTPAFSDVYSDALLSAHEAEIERLQALQQQRAPILAVIERHRSLINDRETLAASANDASRLMGKGTKGEKRDPTRLLREEKMRKRIAKELPKVTAELQRTLENYEDEYGRPFLVHGERYLDELAAAEAKAPPPRCKTPNGLPPRPKTPSIPSAPPSRANNTLSSSSTAKSRSVHAPQPTTRTPTSISSAAGTLRRNAFASSTQSASSTIRSPSKIPARAPLSNLQHGGNSPERQTNIPQYSGGGNRAQQGTGTLGKMGPPRVPPPKMRDIIAEESPVHGYGHPPPPRPGSVQSNSTSGSSNHNGGYIRPMSPEDVYDDRERMSYMSASMSNRDRAVIGHQEDFQSSVIRHGGGHPMHNVPPPISRQISETSSNLTRGTTASGSENWETYSDASQIEAETDAHDVYYTKVRAVNPIKRPGDGYGMMAPPPPKMRMVNQVSVAEHGEERAIRAEGSDAGWTDDSNSY